MPVAFHAGQSLNEIQQHFSNAFPDLKLEFQFRGNEPFCRDALSGKVFSQVRIGELLPERSGQNLDLEDTMTIEEVEQLFGKYFGLQVQIYLRKGGYWLKNHLLSSLTLSPVSLQ